MAFYGATADMFAPTDDDWQALRGYQTVSGQAMPANTSQISNPAALTNLNNARFSQGLSQLNLAGITPAKAAADSNSFGFNLPTLSAVSSGFSGLGSLAQGWAALKGLDLAQDSFAFQKDLAQKNYQNQVTTINNRIRDQNAWKRAQGRTDLASLVV